MSVSPSHLIRAAGAAAIAAGAIFIGVQVGHPPLDLAFITTAEGAVRNTLKVLMAVLALVGITGMYLSQVRRNGVLGLIGYLTLAAGYLLIMSSTFGLAYVLPPIADANPTFVSDVLTTFTGGTAAGDVGVLGAAFQVQSLCYLAGGVLFGVALFRARILKRWAAALLAVGGLVSAALSLMPDALYRLIALPNGIALIGLGYSLWRTQRKAEHHTVGADHRVSRAHRRLMNTRIRARLVPIALVALGAVPVIAGSLRLAELFGGTAAVPSVARYSASPLPVTLHIGCAAVFAMLGALQFAPGLRGHRSGWHRRTGRVLVVAGLGVALSALWLNQYFPRAGATREVLYPLRMVFGVAMIATLVLGFRAARRRDFTLHRAWMIRSYAIGLVAGTQVFTLCIGGAVFGTGDLTTALLLATAWGINLAVAERAIHKRPGRQVATSARLVLR